MWFAPKMTNSTKMSGATAESDRGTLHRRDSLKALSSLRVHWPEYLMEAGELGLYMFFTCAFATLLRHPASPLRHFIVSDVSRRVLMGLAMGVTAIAIVMSPWGKQSGAHFNPGITVAFFWLGKVELWDAFWYATGQFLGGISGVAIATAVLRGAPGDGTVRYAVTVPGVYGDGAAFVAELIISFILMSAILFTSNRESLSPYTPYFSGALIAVYLTLEAPLSGASANPARSLGSAWHAGALERQTTSQGRYRASRARLGAHHANAEECRHDRRRYSEGYTVSDPDRRYPGLCKGEVAGPWKYTSRFHVACRSTTDMARGSRRG